jgi:hypothetical protein
MTDIDQMIDTINTYAKAYMDNAIDASVLAAMRSANRMEYGGSNEDHADPTGHGQTISQ